MTTGFWLPALIWTLVDPCVRIHSLGTPLVVRCLRLLAPKAGGPGLIPGQGTRSHMLQLKIPHATNEKKDPACHNEEGRS